MANKNERTKTHSLRMLVFTAVFAAFICIAAPITIPIGAVPITLATLAIYITGALLPLKQAICAVVLYVLMGSVGLPVFSGFAGGVHILAGATGGYIVGYILCVLVMGLILKLKNDKIYMYAIAMALGTMFIYSCGLVWFCIVTKNRFATALSICMIPFLPVDAIKIVAATGLAFALNKRLKSAMQAK